jgi:hypothetical protein
MLGSALGREGLMCHALWKGRTSRWENTDPLVKDLNRASVRRVASIGQPGDTPIGQIPSIHHQMDKPATSRESVCKLYR